MLTRSKPANLSVRYAKSDAEIQAAQRLRYRVFVQEMGAHASAMEHRLEREIDEFDTHAIHLCLFDQELELTDPENSVVGVYRLVTSEVAQQTNGFYSHSEFDLNPISSLAGRKLELGRTCIHPKYRGGLGMNMLWSELANFIANEKIEYLFGTASYSGTHLDDKWESLSYIQQKFLAPTHLRAQVHPKNALEFTPKPLHLIRTIDAMKSTPALIKAYLRMGGQLGEGVFVDTDFNTLDVFVILEAAQLIKQCTKNYEATN